MPMKCTLYDTLETVCESYGAIAHLGERLFCKQEAVGSSPTGSTKQYLAGVMAASQSPKLLVGVRVPGGMPVVNLLNERKR